MRPSLLGSFGASNYPSNTFNHGGPLNVTHIGWFYTISNEPRYWIECTSFPFIICITKGVKLVCKGGIYLTLQTFYHYFLAPVTSTQHSYLQISFLGPVTIHYQYIYFHVLFTQGRGQVGWGLNEFFSWAPPSITRWAGSMSWGLGASHLPHHMQWSFINYPWPHVFHTTHSLILFDLTSPTSVFPSTPVLRS